MSQVEQVYYRFTSRGPMSDWGHAMFAATRWKVEHYGCNEYHLPHNATVDIWDLEDDIRTAWEQCIEREAFGTLSDTDYWLSVPFDDVMSSFDPQYIVDSAEAYDCDLVGWLWDFVLEPRGIMAVRTRDGAVCFDQDLIIAIPPEEDAA